MKRGDLITAAMAGDYGKPRPCVVIQSDAVFAVDSILVCLMTSTRRNALPFRLDVPVDDTTGLTKPTQIMVDKIMAIPRAKCGDVIGRLPDAVIDSLNVWLSVLIGLAE